MNYLLLARIFGRLLFILSFSMAGCAGYAWWLGRSESGDVGFAALAISAVVALVAGLLLVGVGWRARKEVLRREAVVVVGVGWLISALFGMLPFMLCEPGLSWDKAFFESMSGFTTTGSTTIDSLGDFSAPILLWRALTQWLGGVGILVLFVALLATLGVGGKSLVRLESSLRDGEGGSSRVQHTAVWLLLVYGGLTLLTFGGLRWLGMSNFEAISHALTTVATGGFSIYDDSIGHFGSDGIEIFLAVMMLLCGVNLLVYVAILRGRWRRLRNEEEGKWYLIVIFVSVIFLLINLYGQTKKIESFGEALVDVFFTTVSVMTTTGFGTVDFNLWPAFSQALLLMLMVVGGCSGSTAGGAKVGRFVLFFKLSRWSIVSSFRPKQIFPMTINRVAADLATKLVPMVLTLFGVFIVLGTLCLALFEPSKPLVTCLSAVIATMFNIGPGLGEVGAAGNFSDFSTPSYLLMALLMMFGRLELLTVLALFVPSLWKKY